MKNAFLLVILSISTAFHSPTNIDKNPRSGDVIELDTFVKLINNSLIEANKELNEDRSINLKLKSAAVNIKTICTKEGGFGLKVFLKVSKKWKAEDASEVTFNFTEIEENEKSFEINSIPKFKNQLTAAIVAAAKQFIQSADITGLQKDSFDVKISFGFNNGGNAGVGFEVFGLEIDGSGDSQNTVFHSITLTFTDK